MSKLVNEESLEKLQKLQIEDEDETLVDVDEEDYDDDEEDEEQVSYKLGFLKKSKTQRSLLRHYFPSKAGGVPAWLDPINLPSGKSCLCDICGTPLQFVLQVYAPLFDKESTFHRTLFVLMCSSMKCLLQDQHEQWKRHPHKASRSVKVFRCQLPRSNRFYSEEAERDGSGKPSVNGAPLCSWCGTWKGDKVCAGCKRARYCSEKHQANHWRSAHKAECQKWTSISPLISDSTSTNISVDIPKVASNTIWPEYKIDIRDESEYDTDDSVNASDSLVPVSQMDESYKSVLKDYEGDDDKRSWVDFQARISKAPTQILRYSVNANAKPLWPMSSGRPSNTDIPSCNSCGGTCAFEFQILPTLLHYFGVENNVDSFDWESIVVYTCESSCDDGNSPYKQEFAWIQLPSQSTTHLS